jgi:regulatory protein
MMAGKMSAKDCAVKLLAVRDRSEKEIRSKLSEKEYSEEETEEAIAFCREYGYINDERYAAHFVHDACEIKKFGKTRIKNELKRKGVAQETVEEALSEIENEDELLISEMKRRFSDADFSDEKVKRRVLGFFVRRGFSVRDVIHAMGESEEDCFE